MEPRKTIFVGNWQVNGNVTSCIARGMFIRQEPQMSIKNPCKTVAYRGLFFMETNRGLSLITDHGSPLKVVGKEKRI